MSRFALALLLLLALAPAARAGSWQRPVDGPVALASAARAGSWQRPVDGPVLRGFAVGDNPYSRGQHRGVDLEARVGSPVRSACAGRVGFAGRVPRGGLTVSVRCGAVVATYQQLGSIAVRARADVARAARLGAVGASSDPLQRRPHLHLGAREAATGRYLDPLSLLRGARPGLPLLLPPDRGRPRESPLGPAPHGVRAPRAVPVPQGAPAPHAVPVPQGAPAPHAVPFLSGVPVAPRGGPAPHGVPALPRAVRLGPAPGPGAPRSVPAMLGPAPSRPAMPSLARPPYDPRAGTPVAGPSGPAPPTPWFVWAGVLAFGLALPIGGLATFAWRRHATHRRAAASASHTV